MSKSKSLTESFCLIVGTGHASLSASILNTVILFLTPPLAWPPAIWTKVCAFWVDVHLEPHLKHSAMFVLLCLFCFAQPRLFPYEPPQLTLILFHTGCPDSQFLLPKRPTKHSWKQHVRSIWSTYGKSLQITAIKYLVFLISWPKKYSIVMNPFS